MTGKAYAMYTRLLAAVAANSFSACAFELDPLGCGNRKIILTGWEFSTLAPEDYLANAEEFDKTPADGVVIYIQKNPAAGRSFEATDIMTEPLWTDDNLSDLVAPMKEMTKHASMRHSFIKSFRAPKGVRLDWRDERAWGIVASNVAAVARLARKVGFPGIQMDIEDYSKKRQFWRVETDPPFAELEGIVRLRARQVGKAIFDAYPDITIFSYFGLSELFFLLPEKDVVSLAHAKRDLLPAFLNGLLDVMPPNARFQEGTENAYRYDYAKMDFLTAKTRNSNWYLPLIAPENRAKYKAQVITGLGLYMDSYVNDETSSWYFGPIDGSRLEYLRRNMAQALSGTDEYVWLWGERGRWIDWKKVAEPMRVHGGAKKGRWDEMISGGLFESLRILKDPARYLLPKIEKAIADGKVVNLISNPTCKISIPGEPGLKDRHVPKPFGSWQPTPKEGGSKSLIGADTSDGCGDSTCMFIKGENDGCLTFANESLTPPGSWYYVSASVKGEGAWPSLSFRSGENKWMRPSHYLAIEGKSPTEWRTIRSCVQVPEGATGFTLTLGVRSLGPNEIVRYDNVCVYPLPDGLVTGMAQRNEK